MFRVSFESWGREGEPRGSGGSNQLGALENQRSGTEPPLIQSRDPRVRLGWGTPSGSSSLLAHAEIPEPLQSALAQSIRGHVERRHHEQAQRRRDDRPPITAIAIGVRISEPGRGRAPAGTAAIIVATEVIRIGRSRTGPGLAASPSRAFRPSSRALVGVVDQDDRVLLHDAHQQQQADHAEDVQRLAGRARARTRRPRPRAAGS